MICFRSCISLVTGQEYQFSGFASTAPARGQTYGDSIKCVHCLKMLLPFSPLAGQHQESSSTVQPLPTVAGGPIHSWFGAVSVSDWCIGEPQIHLPRPLSLVRLASLFSCSCYKVCSGFTTATGWRQARKPQWKAVFGCSPM